MINDYVFAFTFVKRLYAVSQRIHSLLNPVQLYLHSKRNPLRLFGCLDLPDCVIKIA